MGSFIEGLEDNEDGEKYDYNRKVVLNKSVPSITQRKPVDLVRLEEWKQTLLYKKKYSKGMLV